MISRQRPLQLGLSDEELRRMADAACGPGRHGYLDGDEYVDSAVIAARRQAWEAAAALVAANNRRLIDQLSHLGLLGLLTGEPLPDESAARRHDGPNRVH
ncbi:MAG: hypothetical protein IT340_21660 [Chloroflexi bacterium]|nr:hypothetical protein [Chloroflexota bacterium]